MYRLNPFTNVERRSEHIRLTTPECSLTLPLSASVLLENLEKDWIKGSDQVEQLLPYGAIISDNDPYQETLFKLSSYFQQKSIPIEVIRKGSLHPEYELPHHCYVSNNEGIGQSPQKSLALLKSLIELYERHSCDVEVNQDILLGEEKGKKVIVDRFAGWQYRLPDFPYSRTQKPSGEWVKATESASGNTILIPLENVCFPDGIDGNRCTEANSSGVAAHTSRVSAANSSLYELIERDSFMVHWFNQVPRDRVKPPDHLMDRLMALEDLGVEINFYNYTLDLLPCVLAVLKSNSGLYPRMVLGMACNPDVEHAIGKALEEVEINMTFSGAEVPDLASPDNIKTILDHQFWYDKPENHHEFDFLWTGHLVDTEEIKQSSGQIDDIYSLFASRGLNWYIVDLNLTGLEQTGIYVVRSIIPGLTSIGFGYRLEPLGGDRIKFLPKQLGIPHSGPRLSYESYRIQPFA